eukprot:jgi/Hompol1/993/HPOL_001168-RA
MPLEALNGVKIPRSGKRTKRITFKDPKTSSKYELQTIQTADDGETSNANETNEISEAGELPELRLLRPDNARQALTAANGFARVFHVAPAGASLADSASLRHDALVAAAEAIHAVPYEPRVHPKGLKLQSLPFGFDAESALNTMQQQQQQQQQQEQSIVAGTVPNTATQASCESRIVLRPYEYLLENPGQDIRNKLIQGFQLFLNVPEDKLDTIKQVIQMLHTASLL